MYSMTPLRLGTGQHLLRNGAGILGPSQNEISLVLRHGIRRKSEPNSLTESEENFKAFFWDFLRRVGRIQDEIWIVPENRSEQEGNFSEIPSSLRHKY